MKLIRHWTAAALAALLTASVLITPGLANPEESFSDFRVHLQSQPGHRGRQLLHPAQV